MLKGKSTRLVKNSQGKGKSTRLMKSSQGKVAATRIVETGTEINNIGIQGGDLEEDDDGVAICTSTRNSKPLATPANEKLAGVPPVTSGPGSAASPVPLSYPVGRGISLPFGRLLPKCDACSCNALIAWYSLSNPKKNGVVCLDHGLHKCYDTRHLTLQLMVGNCRYSFISPEHEAAIRAFFS